MHDYSRDIMLANAQTEMEANLKKMELAKKDNITRINTEKIKTLKKENEDLGFLFLPSNVIFFIITYFAYVFSLQAITAMVQGKQPHEVTAKVERTTVLIAEVLGVGDFCS